MTKLFLLKSLLLILSITNRALLSQNSDSCPDSCALFNPTFTMTLNGTNYSMIITGHYAQDGKEDIVQEIERIDCKGDTCKELEALIRAPLKREDRKTTFAKLANILNWEKLSVSVER